MNSSAQNRIAFWLIPLVGILTYWNSLDTAFVFDDEELLTSAAITQFATQPELTLRAVRPVGYVSFGLNYAVSGPGVWAYHATNLAIHIAAALALYGLARRTFLSPRLVTQFGAAANTLSLSIALLWLVHPLQTESVTYTIQRFESLMGLFYLLSMYFFTRGIVAPHGWPWFVGATALAALAVGTKEVAVTLPLVVLWYDRVFWAANWRELFARRAVWHAALWIIMGVCTFPLAVRVAGALIPQLTETTKATATTDAPSEKSAASSFAGSGAVVVEGVSPVDYLRSQPGVILHYLRLVILPVPQCLDYDWPVARQAGEVVVPAVIIGALLLTAVYFVWKFPAWGFLLGTFFVLLAPTSTIVPIKDLAFEHRMYLPLACVLAGMVVSVWSLLGRFTSGNETKQRKLGRGLLLAVVLALALLTIRRNASYATPVSVWTNVVELRPTNARAQYNLAKALDAAGRDEAAKARYLQVLRYRPDDVMTHNNLGNLAARKAARLAGVQRRAAEDDAVRHFRRVLELEPNFYYAHNNLGLILLRQEKFAEAIALFQQALAIEPAYVSAHISLGNAYSRQEQWADAIASYRRAKELQPDNLAAQGNLEAALRAQSRGQ